MKKLLLSTLFAFAFAGALISCKQDAGLTDATLPMKTTGGTVANPKIAFEGSLSTRKGTVSTLAVMDSDGNHLKNLLTSTSNNNIYQHITWSPSGGHIAWREMASVGNYVAYTLKTGTVTITNNVPTLTSVSTLLPTIFETSDSETCMAAAWTSQSSPSVIAIAGRNYKNNGTAKLWTVSSSGGTPTLLYTCNSGEGIGSISWSPDGTRIAMGVHIGSTGTTYCMKIINASTGAMTDSLGWSQFTGGFANVRWSNSGKNKIAFVARLSGVMSFYTYDYGTSTLSSAIHSIYGALVFWSPSNDKILSIRSGGGVDFYNFPTGTVTSITSGSAGDWRRD